MRAGATGSRTVTGCWTAVHSGSIAAKVLFYCKAMPFQRILGPGPGQYFKGHPGCPVRWALISCLLGLPWESAGQNPSADTAEMNFERCVKGLPSCQVN